MKDVVTSNISHISRKPLQCRHITTPYAGHIVEVILSKSHFKGITMPMICSLIPHGFLPVFSMEVKIMLYFDRTIIFILSA